MSIDLTQKDRSDESASCKRFTKVRRVPVECAVVRRNRVEVNMTNYDQIGPKFFKSDCGFAPIYWTRIFDDYSRGPFVSNSTGEI
jgi:hypothetical protein